MGVSVATPGSISGVGNAVPESIGSVGNAGGGGGLVAVGSSGMGGQYGAAPMGTSSPIATYNPQQAGLNAAGGTTSGGGSYGGGGGGTGGGGGYYDAVAAAAAAEAAAKAGRLQAGRDAVSGLVNSIRGVYDALYGDVGTVATEKTKQLETKYGNEIGSTTDEFNGRFPAIGRAYSGRGAYDSSYRIDSEGVAKTGFSNALKDINYNKGQDLAKVGQYVAQTRADLGAQKGGVEAILGQIGAIDDENALTNLRNELDTKLRTLQASRAGNKSQASYLATLNSTVPGAERAGEIRANLISVVNSAVPTAMKRSITAQMIQGAGIPQDVAQQLSGEINAQLDKEDKQLI